MNSKSIGLSLTVMILSVGFAAKAQTYAESAGVFSRVTPGGSARIQGMGGAQIALGGDYSSSVSNPAGLGMYNKSQVSFSPGFYSMKTTTSFFGNDNSEFRTTVNVPGLSLVLNGTKSCSDCKGFLGGSLGITFNRVNDFNQTFHYKGYDSINSIIDQFTQNANATGSGPSQYDYDNGNNPNFNSATALGYNTYLMNFDAQNGYSANIDNDSYPVQDELVQLKGATNQWNISYGANVSDMFYFGASLGISSLNYKSSKVYSESFSSDTQLKDLTLHEKLSLKGSGANFTIGGIVRPVNFFQVGLSYTTPTVSQLSESWSADMTTNWKDDPPQEYQYTDVVKSDYTLVTPSKLSTGVAFICKYGLITGDLETMNIAGSRYSTTTEGVSFSYDNSDIRSLYRRVLNYRLGIEGRYSMFSLRAGYNVQSNTYKSQYDVNNSINSVSGGVGIKTSKYAVDFALISSSSKGIYAPYNIAPTVNLKNNLVRGVFTFSATF